MRSSHSQQQSNVLLQNCCRLQYVLQSRPGDAWHAHETLLIELEGGACVVHVLSTRAVERSSGAEQNPDLDDDLMSLRCQFLKFYRTTFSVYPKLPLSSWSLPSSPASSCPMALIAAARIAACSHRRKSAQAPYNNVECAWDNEPVRLQQRRQF